MDFKIENQPVFTSLRVKLGNGETIKAEGGAMISMSPNIELKAKTAGKGIGGIFKAAIGGEGLFMSEYTASNGPGEVVLAPSSPGDIIDLNLSGNTVFAQSGAFLAGEGSVTLSTQGSLKAMISGEGLFLQKLSGTGKVFLNSYGAIILKELAAGEAYVVDTGNMVAFEESVTYKIKKASKGIFSSLASGEGLVCEFSGPGKVWLQTRDLKGFAQLLYSLMPQKNN